MKNILILALLVFGCLTSSETTTATESTTAESTNSTASTTEHNSTATETNSSTSGSAHTTSSEPIDINELPCKNAEFAEETKESVMDGKCIRSYYRVD